MLKLLVSFLMGEGSEAVVCTTSPETESFENFHNRDKTHYYAIHVQCHNEKTRKVSVGREFPTFALLSIQRSHKTIGSKERNKTNQSMVLTYRSPDKSVYLKIIFLISHPKHMLWVLKRIVSMRRFF